VEVALPDPGVMLAGEKEQFRALERPLHESEMGVLKDPDCVCAVTVKVPDLPAGMITDNGDALKANVGGGGVTATAHEGL
jgi:hypothetical protein